MVSTAIILFCTCAAFVAGFIDSIAGGGGLITIPALLLSGLPPQLALGTNKVGCCLGTGVAMLNFARSNLILWRLALLGVGFSLVGAGIGTELALYISPDLLGKVLVLLLPFAMLATLMPKKEQKNPPLTSGRRYWILAPLCFLIVGIYDGFFGPGTGSFLILALHWVLRISLLEASATSKVMNFASNLGAMFLFIWNGAVIWSVGLPMMAANIAGNWLGSRLAIKVGTEAVRRFLWISLSLLLATLIWRFFISPYLLGLILPLRFDTRPAAMRCRLFCFGPGADRERTYELRRGDDWLPNHHMKKIVTACPCPGGVLEQEKTALAGKRSPVC